MPIRKFEYYGQLNAIQKLPMGVLENTTIAIDGFWYFKKYLAICTEEQFADHLSILSQCLAPLIEVSRSASVIWIWDGLEYKQPVPFDFKKFIENVFTKIINRKFGKIFFDQELFVECATRILRDNGISVIRAPYLASAQCVYLLKKNCVTYVFSKNDALLYNDCHKLILDFDFPNSRVEIINRADMLKNNHFGLEAFRRIAFLSGCEICSTIPILASNFDLLSIIEIVKNNNMKELLGGFRKDIEAKYLDEYYRSFIVVDFHPVMHLDGSVRCMSDVEAPADLDKIFGKKLSDDLYQDIFTCSLGIKALSNSMFQRPKEEYKTKILNVFESVLSSGVKSGRNEKISDCMRRTFGIEWSGCINKLVQAAFMSLSTSSFGNSPLLKLLNSGATNDERAKPVGDDLLAVTQKYSHENLEMFYRANEYIVLMRDLVLLMKFRSRMEDDMFFELTYNKFHKDFKEDELGDFLAMNKERNPRFKDMMALLENK